jgi:putative heme iron utilization protein
LSIVIDIEIIFPEGAVEDTYYTITADAVVILEGAIKYGNTLFADNI